LRKIDLTPYKVQVGEGFLPYNIREAIEAVLLASGSMTTQRLSVSELLRNARIAEKIKNAEGNSVLLEESEYKVLRKSFEAFRGFGKNEVEMCKRIMEAETVKVQEKK